MVALGAFLLACLGLGVWLGLPIYTGRTGEKVVFYLTFLVMCIGGFSGYHDEESREVLLGLAGLIVIALAGGFLGWIGHYITRWISNDRRS